MLVSHCGEYPCECKQYIFASNSPDSGECMANGLTNAIRHQSQWSQNDRQIFVGVRKHSRSFVRGVANIILLSHCGEYLANIQHLYSRHIRQKWYDCPGELLKKWSLSNGYECFRISYESLRISYEAYDQSAEFRVNPLRMLRVLTNVLRSQQMPCHQ